MLLLKVLAGALALLALLYAAAALYGAWRWDAGTRELRARLRAPGGGPARADASPGLRLERPYRPMLPGLPVRVHDAYVSGEGILRAKVLGLFTVADLRGTREIAQGELMRYLAEAAWYPTALLPSQGVRWEAVDGESAKATLADGDVSATLLFRFDGAGLIASVSAEARGRTVHGAVVPTPWEGRWWSYAKRGGMQVPLEGEVAWILPEALRPYWRGRVARLEYEFAQ